MNRSECRKAIIAHLPVGSWMRATELRAYIAHELDTDDVPLSIFSLMNDRARLAALDVPSIWKIWRELRRMQKEGLVVSRRTTRYRLNLPVGYVREWKLQRVCQKRMVLETPPRYSVVQ
ncbi:hypothetical protein JNK62_04455 [bacterium]|nr:hypothetical protein [bacterium]